MRRRFQRTTDNNIRQERRNQYIEAKRGYQAKIQREKLKSWKEFCTISDGTNPWNVIYKIAAGKLKPPISLTTIQKPDGTYTNDIKSTLKHMLDYFVPDDSLETDNEHHKEIRKQAEKSTETSDDMDFTQQEILSALKDFNPHKAPGEDVYNQ